jgi:hypothetical protein
MIKRLIFALLLAFPVFGQGFAISQGHPVSSLLSTPGAIPSPWIDVTSTSNPNGAVTCTNGSPDSTSAFNGIITEARSTKGVKIWIPPGCNFNVTGINLSSYQGPLTIEGGYGSFGLTASITVTGNCSLGACVTFHNGGDVHLHNLVLKFPNCTTTPCIDESASQRVIWDHSGMVGPSISTNGPTLIDLETSVENQFLNGSWCQQANICMTGSLTGSLGALADNVTVHKFICRNVGTVCFQNPATAFSFEDVSAELCNANNTYAQAINYSSFIGMVDLLLKNFVVVGGPGSGCNNAVSFITLPNSTSVSIGNATFINYNPIGAMSSPTQTGLTIGNNNSVTLISPACQGLSVCIAVSTGAHGVNLTVTNPATDGHVATFLSGTPAGGMVQDFSGSVTFYSPTTRFVEQGSCANSAGTDALCPNSKDHALIGSYNGNSAHPLWLSEVVSCTISAGAKSCNAALPSNFAVVLMTNAALDQTAMPPVTAIAATCSVSGTTVTITTGASTASSLLWDCQVIGR